MNDYMTLLHKHKINGGFLAPDRIPMEERNKNEMILELQNEVHIKDKEIERLKEDNEYLNKVNIELSSEKNRLNNIINELEKWLEEDLKQVYRDAGYRHNLILEVLDKLQELKNIGLN